MHKYIEIDLKKDSSLLKEFEKIQDEYNDGSETKWGNIFEIYDNKLKGYIMTKEELKIAGNMIIQIRDTKEKKILKKIPKQKRIFEIINNNK